VDSGDFNGMTDVYIAVVLLSFMSVLTMVVGVALAIQFRENEKGVAIGIGVPPQSTRNRWCSAGPNAQSGG